MFDLIHKALADYLRSRATNKTAMYLLKNTAVFEQFVRDLFFTVLSLASVPDNFRSYNHPSIGYMNFSEFRLPKGLAEVASTPCVYLSELSRGYKDPILMTTMPQGITGTVLDPLKIEAWFRDFNRDQDEKIELVEVPARKYFLLCNISGFLTSGNEFVRVNDAAGACSMESVVLHDWVLDALADFGPHYELPPMREVAKWAFGQS